MAKVIKKTKKATPKAKKETKKKVIKKPIKKVVKKSVKKPVKKPLKTPVKKKKIVYKLKTRIKVKPKKRIGGFPKLKKVRSRIAASIKVRKIKSKDVILVLDFGSQYTQLIARRTRESKVYSKIVPYNITAEEIRQIKPKGIIFSGGPLSVFDKKAPAPIKEIYKLDIPILGVCYGMQIITEQFEGKVKSSNEREFGRAELFIDSNKDLFANMPSNLTCWMSHSDEIKKLPKGFVRIAHTLNADVAAFANRAKKIYGVQFHPEVIHTQRGSQILNNFLFGICGCLPRWTMDKFIDASVNQIKETIGSKKVVLGLSGGVDSAVAAAIISKAVGKKLYCIFVDNGLLRKNEVAAVQKAFKGSFKMNLSCVNAEKGFLKRLKGITDPEEKRKIIGDEFIKVFTEKAKRIKDADFLAQGTLYPDVIESHSPIGGPSAVIKSHHNVGGLPKNLKFKLVEPLSELFKDEVRVLGKHLGLPDTVLKRQPFPGPGLGIRIIGDVTKERLDVLRDADEIVLDEIKKEGLYNDIWQSFAVLLPVKTVGVMGDQRTYEDVIAIRCVTSVDGMTADWAQMPYELLGKISNRIINEVQGVNRVVYDVSSKPPATIEWE
ncbi:MAG: glutamine-hydrolyzing GMP synthase [Candidatus Zapsychrus exili]|nr:glutamine-hydrolyzing GMP synthase [Candidatus Zapsychrus exili]